jgi:hypothetical protein
VIDEGRLPVIDVRDNGDISDLYRAIKGHRAVVPYIGFADFASKHQQKRLKRVRLPEAPNVQ